MDIQRGDCLVSTDNYEIIIVLSTGTNLYRSIITLNNFPESAGSYHNFKAMAEHFHKLHWNGLQHENHITLEMCSTIGIMEFCTEFFANKLDLPMDVTPVMNVIPVMVKESIDFYTKMFKFLKISLKTIDDTNEDMCSICIEPYQNNKCVVTNECNHIFHVDCLNTWCNKKHTCPNCRKDLRNRDV